MQSNKYSRAPKQSRSRLSWEKLLDSATVLLEKRGYHDFSIVEVSKKSKISIGSIYGRVDSKDDLIRSVQERVLNKVDRDYEAFWEEVAKENLPLEPRFRRYVEYHAEFLKRHSALFRAFISRASMDPVIRKRGKASHSHFTELFTRSLLECRDEIHHQDPEHALLACSRLLWSSFASFLGIESDESVDDGDFGELINDVSEMGLFFLASSRRLNGHNPAAKRVVQPPKKAATRRLQPRE